MFKKNEIRCGGFYLFNTNVGLNCKRQHGALSPAAWWMLYYENCQHAAHATANGKLACGKLIHVCEVTPRISSSALDTEKLLTDQHLYVKTNISIILLGLAKQPYH